MGPKVSLARSIIPQGRGLRDAMGGLPGECSPACRQSSLAPQSAVGNYSPSMRSTLAVFWPRSTTPENNAPKATTAMQNQPVSLQPPAM